MASRKNDPFRKSGKGRVIYIEEAGASIIILFKMVYKN